MTTAKEKCAGILAGFSEIIQACENPVAKDLALQARDYFQQAIAGASEMEAEMIIRKFQDAYLDEGDRND